MAFLYGWSDAPWTVWPYLAGRLSAIALVAGLALTTPGAAAPEGCPVGIETFHPQQGDLFVSSPKNELRRIRHNYAGIRQPVMLEPDAGISFYYFTAPQLLATPMLFALLRAYKVREGSLTSLSPSKIYVSNSATPRGKEYKFSTSKYNDFHEYKHTSFNSLRKYFHMPFRDRNLSSNSYDNLENPQIYLLPAGDGFSGYKARIQRISGFPKGGRCVEFDLFKGRRFADAMKSLSITFIALKEKSAFIDDGIKFSVTFRSE